MIRIILSPEELLAVFTLGVLNIALITALVGVIANMKLREFRRG